MKKKIILSVAVVLLVVMIATICAACTPSIDAVAKKFENKGYKATKTETTVLAVKVDKEDGIVGAATGPKILITWYDNDEDAQKAYDAALKVGSEKTVAKKGNAVAVGDEDSIKIFK